MKWFKPVVFSLLAVGVFVLLEQRFGDIPAAGGFLDPFSGFWQNNSSCDELPGDVTLAGLRDSVRILWDERRVPHIFARNTHDLLFAQGYCLARDRLWQMDFQARAAAGRLSEVVGARTVARDRFARHIGLPVIAERMARSIESDTVMREAAGAYCAGVNAWIASLDARRLPVEFKILGYRPEPWSTLKIGAGFANFCLSLSFSGNDSAMTLARSALSDSLYSVLYPATFPLADPIVPAGTRWDFSPVRVAPRRPRPQTWTGAAHGTGAGPGEGAGEEARGSNNWAVVGSRTAHGCPILCSDPHLGLTLPSIWYEIQLACPELNVYGVSTPGAPGILIGFNEHIAFGETNAQTDVLDWYRITFRDPSCNEYLYDGQWRPTQKRVEVIAVRGAPDVVDTLVFTHHGPVVTRAGERPVSESLPQGCALRWTALDSSASLKTFLLLNAATGYGDFVRALKQYDSPAQNFAYADNAGNIALWHNGKFPLRQKDQGRTLEDGADPSREWQGWIPHEHVPHVLNPRRGFVSSANQPPADATYPYVLNGGYSSFERSRRINQRLSGLPRATVNDMMSLQNDIVNLRAVRTLPVILPMIDPATLTSTEQDAYRDLARWQYDQSAGLVAPQIFEYWWRAILSSLWSHLRAQDGRRLPLPRADVTMELMFSGRLMSVLKASGRVGARGVADIVRSSFEESVGDLETEFGPFGPSWALGKSRGTDILHLAQIPGLGRPSLSTGGNYATVNATQRRTGPSWRMITELTPWPQGWGVYPGGQSGNPGSVHYDAFVDTWLDGRYYDLLFLRSPTDSSAQLIGQSVLRGAQ